MDYEPSNVLLVEDETAHAELTKRAIRKAGNANRIDVVTDGEEALDYVLNRGNFSDIDFHILNFTALSVVGVLQYSLLPLAL